TLHPRCRQPALQPRLSDQPSARSGQPGKVARPVPRKDNASRRSLESAVPIRGHRPHERQIPHLVQRSPRRQHRNLHHSMMRSRDHREWGGCVLRSKTRRVAQFRYRPAYTLMELLLVLAIIVIAAAAAAPAFRGVMRSATLRSAANEVRAALAKTHVMAMRSGRTHLFQYELGGSKYKMEPYIAGDDELESAAGDPSGAM